MILTCKIIGHIKNIAINKIGTYPLQSVIDHMRNNEEKNSIINGILPVLKDISMVISLFFTLKKFTLKYLFWLSFTINQKIIFFI